MSRDSKQTSYLRYRLLFVQTTMLCAAIALLWKMFDINLNQRRFLQGEGDARYLRDMAIPAHRGAIVDRNGEVLAVSTPVDSIWANPLEILDKGDVRAVNDWQRRATLAKILGISTHELSQRIQDRAGRQFVYLKRHASPDLAQMVAELKLTGIYLQREYRRYYPTGEIFSHVVGFTDIDDKGQEGIELMLDEKLQGTPGSKRVIRDRLGRTIENVASISDPQSGMDLQLSLDKRVQYLAYRELKATVKRHKAKGGSAVILDTLSGEILAMVNQPGFNPNNRRGFKRNLLRNRAVTDIFEPGSTMKPFTIAAALESGHYAPTTPIDTNPGFLKLAGFTIRDHRNYEILDLAGIIQKSSNVGASKIALSLEPSEFWAHLANLGLGAETGSGFPGEQSGTLSTFHEWRKTKQATISYGYGLSTTLLQLTRAYGVLAAGGVLKPVTFIKGGDEIQDIRVFTSEVTSEVVKMMQRVVENGGTGTRASVAGYHIAGKTGTVRKISGGAYGDEDYLALFAGIAPATRPRLAMVIVIDQPDSGDYYGGVVAAPLFSKVMTGALRLLDIAPDAIKPGSGLQLAELDK